MDDIANSYTPQIICLTSQIIATAYTLIRIRDNQFSFPVKQLSPIITAAALMCFILANLVSFIARIIEKEEGYYVFNKDKSQCRTTNHPEMIVLGIMFCMLRELPLVFFSLKTLRVSLCFWPWFNTKENQQIKPWIIKIFRSEMSIIGVSSLYVAIINFINLIIIWSSSLSDPYSNLFFQFFCPGKTTPLQSIVILFRFLLFALAYLSCTWTYKELDFKKFLIIIFFYTNILTFVRFFLLFYNSATKTYHEFYYGSLLICLIGTLILAYYSGINDQLNEPAMQGILYSWMAFSNFGIGMTILREFSFELDRKSTFVQYHYLCLDSYMCLDEFLKSAKELTEEQIQVIQQILEKNELIKSKIQESEIAKLKEKCIKKSITISEVKYIERLLSQFCQEVIFREWKKTQSFLHLKKEFAKNGNINQKLELFRIPIN